MRMFPCNFQEPDVRIRTKRALNRSTLEDQERYLNSEARMLYDASDTSAPEPRDKETTREPADER